MTPEALLAEKLPAYRALFDRACSALFEGGEGITVDLDDDDERAPNSNSGSNSVDVDRGATVRAGVMGALHDIADDFAREFNRKLSTAAAEDASVGMVASNYEMTAEHVDELTQTLASSVAVFVGKLGAGDLEAARRASIDAWPLLERRLRSKWQAYFVFTFQDVSVERKAARDRRKLQQRFDPDSAPISTPQPNAKLDALPDLAAVDGGARTRSPWIAVLALLLLAGAAAWFLLRHAGH